MIAVILLAPLGIVGSIRSLAALGGPALARTA